MDKKQIKERAHKILLARKEKDLKQEDAAKLLNVAPITVGRWERAQSEPEPGNIKSMEAIYEKPSGYFDIIKEPSAQYGSSDVDLSSVHELTGDNIINLPLLADIPAGLPEFSSKDVESFTQIPRYLFPGADFVIKCIGDSMQPEIPKGAFCVIRKETEALHNAIMIVKTEEGFTIKRVIKKDNTIELHPANADHKVMRPKQIKIIGEVIGTWNRIKPR